MFNVGFVWTRLLEMDVRRDNQTGKHAMLRKALPILSMSVLVVLAGFIALLRARVEGAVLPLPPAISEDAGAPVSIDTLFAALAATALRGSAQGARAEPAPSLRAAISDDVTRYSQMEQTPADAILNITFARGARRGGDRGGSARRARSGSGDGHMGSGFGDLVGGNFALPYFNYCARRPGDQNC
jgi:hypothetical protein